MQRENTIEIKELALTDGEYLYCQDTAKGHIKTYSGPTLVTMTGQESPVHFDPVENTFRKTDLHKARKQCPIAKKGQYLILHNPAVADEGQLGKQPNAGSVEIFSDLQIGCKINLPGPISVPLWPRQSAEVVEGHQLRSNEYLLLFVNDEAAAKENWGTAVIRIIKNGLEEEGSKAKLTDISEDFSSGKKYFILRGTEVSFFIPPTGIEVIKQESTNSYIRKALTLENLEYCITLDEDGTKEYQYGPQVVFLKPTQKFLVQKNKKTGAEERIFKPIELNPIQALHIKVIADYKDTDGTIVNKGEELLIRGDAHPIYYPRHEHSIITYDNQQKHYATEVSSGEGRYVLERMTGVIKVVKGPAMLLCDPRKEVMVRRALTDKEVSLWYPGNTEALEYNRALKETAKRSPSTRAGLITEGEIERSGNKLLKSKSSRSNDRALQKSYVNSSAPAMIADQFTRGTSYTEARHLVFDNRFKGVPTICVHTGYAVMVVNKSGNRKVHVGPVTVLLEYDETLEILQLSVGRPKSDTKTLKTPYLRINNHISDTIEVESKDHVWCQLDVSFQVDFEGSSAKEQEKWFDVDNYVKLLTDHVRSILKSHVRSLTVGEFYLKSTEIIRDKLLGPKVNKKGEESPRKGLAFSKNNMRLCDIDVLNVRIRDESIAQLLKTEQHYAVESTITLAKKSRQLEVFEAEQNIGRKHLEITAKTHQIEVENRKNTEQRELELYEVVNSKQKIIQTKEQEIQAERDKLEDMKQAAVLARKQKDAEVQGAIQSAENARSIEFLNAETKSTVERFNAASGPFTEAITGMANKQVVENVAKAMSVQSLIGGDNFVEAFQKLKGSGVDKLFEGIVDKSAKGLFSNGSNETESRI